MINTITAKVTWDVPQDRAKMAVSVLEARATIDLVTGEVSFFVSYLDADGIARQSDPVLATLSPETLGIVTEELMTSAQSQKVVPKGKIVINLSSRQDLMKVG